MAEVDTISLQAELADLAARVSALERAALDTGAAENRGEPEQPAPAGSASERPSTIAGAIPGDDTFWALTGLRDRRPDHPTTAEGAVMLVGSLTLPDGAPVAWQQSAGTEGLLESAWDDRAETFSALAHPVRIELLRHILSGMHATADLADLDSVGTTGQLHHHLRQLLAAGWVRQSGRGSYEVPAPRVVPLLVCLLGAQR
ncbi:helix-turn-helix transcriptional regulator [Pseudactinotalea sp. HY158]|uniref:ArsR/SmtB family transcription factor n=1 Tax=Pseudactinotalea sp. HY158 TaxID=2654547 RepID=UPI00129D155E|nr:helix-turn-helix domain-containing protein [Pseudactinotalea sp. HY158]QGH68617.1 helix-turn-helix domain-containing protein [Pseudactinotalea sp. HY158]